MIRARGAETRQKLLEAITAVAAEVQRAAESLKTHPERLRRFVFGLIGLAAGYFTTREAALLARGVSLTQYLMRPALVRESSFSMSGLLVWSLGLVWKLLMTLLLFRRGPGHDGDVTVGQGGVENDENHRRDYTTGGPGKRLDQLAKSIRGARKLRAPLRHLLLFVRQEPGRRWSRAALSQISGLDWAIMSGGDVGLARSCGFDRDPCHIELGP